MSYITITVPFDFDPRDVPEGTSQWLAAYELFRARMEDPTFLIERPDAITFCDVEVQDAYVY